MNYTHELTPAYRSLFEELSDSAKYRVRNVHEHYVINKGIPDEELTTVVLRIDVDNALHLAKPLADWIDRYGLTASHYFLTHPKRYYNIWNSSIPRYISRLGQEVGLHSDHYFEQLSEGVDGLSVLRNDVRKLGDLIGEPVKGMVFHGHNEIDALGTTNWELTKDLESSSIGLIYHDGLKSVYIDPESDCWKPHCDINISDFFGFSQSWGWNYMPWYPTRVLKKNSGSGKVVHIAFHTMNAFYYWLNWDRENSEEFFPKEEFYVFWYKRLMIIYNYYIRQLWRRPLVSMLEIIGIKNSIKKWLRKY